MRSFDRGSNQVGDRTSPSNSAKSQNQRERKRKKRPVWRERALQNKRKKKKGLAVARSTPKR